MMAILLQFILVYIKKSNKIHIIGCRYKYGFKCLLLW